MLNTGDEEITNPPEFATWSIKTMAISEARTLSMKGSRYRDTFALYPYKARLSVCSKP